MVLVGLDQVGSKMKALISRSLIKEILDELMLIRDNCKDLGDMDSEVRLQSIIYKLCAELALDIE